MKRNHVSRPAVRGGEPTLPDLPDSRDSSHRYIYIAEEWDPEFVYGKSFWYGNPYGRHKEPLVTAFQAENEVDFHRMVV